MTHPREHSLMETYRFLVRVLTGSKRILEVGCGRGTLAAKLGAEGFTVTALDKSLSSLEAHGAPGVTFVERDFLDYEAEPFEAVFFVASLHHIPALDRALLQAHHLLLPGGLLVAEEFALEAPDIQTARWYYEIQGLLAASGLYPPERIRGSEAEGPQERWSAEHMEVPPLHAGAAMTAAVAQRFELLEVTPGPYLYRYICGGLEASGRGESIARFLLETERRRLAEGTLKPVGLRLLARKR
jgi:SAM-dependent methyltransferase